MSRTPGARIAHLRGTRGVIEFADALGVNRKTVTRWEADEALPDGASLIALKEKFGADPGWVLVGYGDAPTDLTLSADERVLLDGYRALDPATRKRLLAFVLGPDAEIRATVAKKIKTQINVGTNHGQTAKKITNKKP